MPKSFAEMLVLIEQHHQGLISTTQLILQLQCDEFQINALIQASLLPATVYHKMVLSDWDEDIARDRHIGRRVQCKESID